MVRAVSRPSGPGRRSGTEPGISLADALGIVKASPGVVLRRVGAAHRARTSSRTEACGGEGQSLPSRRTTNAKSCIPFAISNGTDGFPSLQGQAEATTDSTSPPDKTSA
jgi:hypothetical protein